MSTLEDLIAMNEEVTLLAKAGVPLDPTMVKLGRNRQHELTRINAAVARRVGRGEPLVDAVAADDTSMPERYQDIVEAGIRCGRLPILFEDLCDDAQSTLSLKRGLATAMIYPILIATLAFGLFVASLVFYIPTLVETYRELAVPYGPALEACRLLRSTLPVWGPIPVIALLLWGIACCRGIRRPTIGWTGSLALLSRMPWIRSAVQDASRASVARLTALLLEHNVSLADSLRLATGATGDRRLLQAVEQWRNTVDSSQQHPPLSPLLQWAITYPGDTSSAGTVTTHERIDALRLAADLYHTRAERRLQRLRRWIPVVALVVIGGGAALVYFLSVFGPFVQLIQGLAFP